MPKVLSDDEILERIRTWVIREELRRVKRNEDDFYINQGYLLCLSNLMELIHKIEDNPSKITL